MSRVIALAPPLRTAAFEAMRMLIVCTCAIALIAAGQALPLL